MTNGGLFRRALRRASKEVTAVTRAWAFGRAADGSLAAVALFAVGMAHATPGRWCSRVLRGLGVRRLRVRPRRLGGYELAVDPSDGGHTCVVEEFFLPPVACDLSLIDFDPAAVIDCGAHIGVFTLLARRRFPSAAITAFEPNPDIVEWLRENLGRNRLCGVDVVQAAVSTVSGRSGFRFTRYQSESGRLVEPAATPNEGEELTEVAVIGLPAFIRELAVPALVLKLDIEGEEERLIPALVPALPPRCAIFFETHRGAEGWEAVRGPLAAAEFSVRLIRRRDVFCDGFAVRS